MHTPTSQLRRDGDARRRRGFTLTELLIVIGLIVLLIALAVPAFRAMTGGRSIDAAQNQLAAVLGAARAEAIGLQKVRGVLFYLDPATDRVNAAIVREVGYSPLTPVANPPDYYLDLVPDRDPVALPVGIALQGVDSADMSGATRKDDGYIGFNPLNATPAPPGNDASQRVQYGGVILFDGYGRVISKFYGFLLGERPDPTSKRIFTTRLGEVFGYAAGENNSVPPHYIPLQLGVGTPQPPAQSMLGFVLYDAETFRSLGYKNNDPQFDPAAGSYANEERGEEDWLDKNAAPVLINRYNGSLIRGE
jgi:prepilin-type N-terminal cleavage/methylation domain-containing protein